ncbi:MAG TPA: hypothetical protein VLL74_00575 [Methanoregula sp.]|nr:hypothetical protein [Methanoregula sp.]
MSPYPFVPIPPELFAHACATVTTRVSQLPFLRGGVNVTGELVGVAMECLNAVPSRMLALSTPQGTGEDGLDRCLEERLHIPGKAVTPVIVDVLCAAGIAETALVSDRHAHRQLRAIRLLPRWTWHIASTMAPSVRLGGDDSLSWLDLCPVCRTGILDHVRGKQLFGVPRTDFYIECSSCGAKFIPVGPAFRLVSIATIRDPLWKKHLDKTYPPETWAALARGPGTGSTPVLRPAIKKTEVPSPLPPAAVTFSQLKDGSLAVPVGGITRYFRPVPLTFSGGIQKDTFARVQTTLADLLVQPAYEHLRSPVNAKYSRYLPMKAGLFLSQLKERHDPFYRGFLNPFGDEKYCTFRAADFAESEKPAVMIVVVNRGLYHAISVPDTVRAAVSNRLGRIGPDTCLLSGDPVRCRINALLSNHRKVAGLYCHAMEKEDERQALTSALESLIAVGHS